VKKRLKVRPGARFFGMGVTDAAVVVGSAVAMDGGFAVVGLVVTSAMGNTPDRRLYYCVVTLILRYCAGLKARFNSA
jgi:hypothetical protein